MTKTILLALVLAGLIVGHNAILDNSLDIAKGFASVPYQPVSDEELGLQPLAAVAPHADAVDRVLTKAYNSNLEKSNALARYAHYLNYLSTSVRPLQKQIDFYANIAFSLAYLLLAAFTATSFYRWMQAVGGVVVSGGFRRLCGVAGRLTGGLGLKGAIRNHQLGRAEAEFVRLKNLFDNGLVTEAEFLAKKVELASKIRDDNLLNRG